MTQILIAAAIILIPVVLVIRRALLDYDRMAQCGSDSRGESK